MSKNYRAELVGVFGDPVDDNPTGAMEEAAFSACGLNYRYITYKVTTEDFDAAVKAIKALHMKGMNLTMPHKINVLPYLDEISQAAFIIGAVNTILVREDGTLFGENTDGKGFVQSLTNSGVTCQDKNIVILGAGGAAKSIAVECALAGAKMVTIINRTKEKADALAEVLNTHTEATAYAEEWVACHTIPEGTDILINGTSIGFTPNDEEKPDINYDDIHEGMIVSDVVFSPVETLFLKEAAAHGATTLTGLGMLACQGALNFTIWTGEEAPLALMEETLRKETGGESGKLVEAVKTITHEIERIRHEIPSPRELLSEHDIKLPHEILSEHDIKLPHEILTNHEMKQYDKMDELPTGRASSAIQKGCLVIEGGAFRGLYNQGVLDALMLNDINIHTVIGVSAGALAGMNYVSGQIGRSVRANLGYRYDSRYIGRKALRNGHSILNLDFLLDTYDEYDPLDREKLESDDRHYVAVATNCLNGQPVFYDKDNCSNILDAIKASASMPYITPMVDVDGIPCLDGGCSNKIPYRWALDQGFDKIVVIRTRERGFKKSEDTHKIATKVYAKYPEFAESLKKSNADYNRQCAEIDELEAQKRIFVIAPSEPVTVSRLEKDLNKLGDLYWEGYHDTIRQLDAIRAYLK